ncbi:MAG: type II toxin-antitoxin system Phd/YefM family antitoxin [bacterium]|nr:type II toxin-antitoxin system Phd/YefM family antitoxin [bacterium]
MNTKIFTAKEAKNNFGHLLDSARANPVAIEKHGRKVAVVLSTEDYEEFEKFRDIYWAIAAEEASKKGYLGVRKSRELLNEMLNA